MRWQLTSTTPAAFVGNLDMHCHCLLPPPLGDPAAPAAAAVAVVDYDAASERTKAIIHNNFANKLYVAAIVCQPRYNSDQAVMVHIAEMARACHQPIRTTHDGCADTVGGVQAVAAPTARGADCDVTLGVAAPQHAAVDACATSPVGLTPMEDDLLADEWLAEE